MFKVRQLTCFLQLCCKITETAIQDDVPGDRTSICNDKGRRALFYVVYISFQSEAGSSKAFSQQQSEQVQKPKKSRFQRSSRFLVLWDEVRGLVIHSYYFLALRNCN